jgi:hypothetical protein
MGQSDKFAGPTARYFISDLELKRAFLKPFGGLDDTGDHRQQG